MSYEFKVPTSKEEMDALRKTLRQEIDEDMLDAVVGGNDDVKGKNKDKEGTPWECPFCGKVVMIYQFHDGPKHMTKCPGNPYK